MKLFWTVPLLTASLCAQDEKAWLAPLLETVPDEAALVGALSIPARDFLDGVYGLLDEVETDWLDTALRRTPLEGTNGLIDMLSEVLQPRVAVVVRRNIQDPDIPVAEPSPLPQIAFVFWIDGDARPPLIDILRRHYQTLGFENAYELAVARNARDRILELTNREIIATGEIALSMTDSLLLIGNSGPLIRTLLTTQRRGAASIADALDGVSLADPNRGSGIAILHVPNLRRIAEGFEQAGLEGPRAEQWSGVLQKLSERQVFSRDYADRYVSSSVLRGETREEFEQRVATYQADLWERDRSARLVVDPATALQSLALLAGR